MSDEQNQAKLKEEQLELEAERKLKSRVHRHMGMTAAVLGIVATFVALARMRSMFGISPWEALGIGAGAMPWVVAILVAIVLLSMGTSRLLLAVNRISRWLTRKH
jgi:hypothetical protein